MAEYNNQSIDIDLEEIFNGLPDEDQKESLVDMFQNLEEENRKNVVKHECTRTCTNVHERTRTFTL